MPLVDARKLVAKLDSLGMEEVRVRLASGAFGARKRPLVEEWLRRTEQLPPPDTYLYHPTEAPTGRLFHASQVESLRTAGWLDSPSKFPKNRLASVARWAKIWWSEWEWFVKAIGIVLGVLTGLVTLAKLFF